MTSNDILATLHSDAAMSLNASCPVVYRAAERATNPLRTQGHHTYVSKIASSDVV